MSFLSALKDTFDSGDPTLRTWPLVDSYWYPFLLSALYVFFIKNVGPTLMKNRKPFELRNVMIVYNFCIVFVYTSCILTLFYYLVTVDDPYHALCSHVPVVKNHYSYTCVFAGWIIYLLKYVEFGDTVFFLLRKKYHLITNLHVIHHAVLPILCWILMRTERSGFQFIIAGINSVVHIIMYTYYGLAAMGPEVQKKLWWKKHLTRLQMLQFVVILLFMFVVVPISGCKTALFGIYMDIVFATLFLTMFYNFYRKTYIQKPKKGAYSTSNGVNGVHDKSNGVHITNGLLTSNGTHKSNGVYHKED